MERNPFCWVLLVLAVALPIAIQGRQQNTKMAPDLPLYWGWFLKQSDTKEFLKISTNTLQETLSTIPEFLEDAKRFTGAENISAIIDHYTREDPDDVLHCTAMYNGVAPDYSPGAEEYANKQAVKNSVDEPFIIQAIGWVLTPRTFGARLKLNSDQLELWNQDDNQGNPEPQNRNAKIAASGTKNLRSPTMEPVGRYERVVVIPQDPDVPDPFHPTSGFGSRAHFTLGCAPNISAVTTGFDLVDVIKLENSNATYPSYPLTSGTLRNYGQGQWVFYPETQCLIAAAFRGSDAGTASAAGKVSPTPLATSLVVLSGFIKWLSWRK